MLVKVCIHQRWNHRLALYHCVVTSPILLKHQLMATSALSSTNTSILLLENVTEQCITLNICATIFFIPIGFTVGHLPLKGELRLDRWYSQYMTLIAVDVLIKKCPHFILEALNALYTYWNGKQLLVVSMVNKVLYDHQMVKSLLSVRTSGARYSGREQVHSGYQAAP